MSGRETGCCARRKPSQRWTMSVLPTCTSGTDPTGGDFIVMQYVEGETLALEGAGRAPSLASVRRSRDA